MTIITHTVNHNGKDVYCPFSRNKCRANCMFLLASDSSEYLYCSLNPKYHKYVYIQEEKFESTKFKHGGN